MLICRLISIRSTNLTSSAEVRVIASSITQLEERAITSSVAQIGQCNYIKRHTNMTRQLHLGSDE